MRHFVCQDCGNSQEHPATTGCVPKRCRECNRLVGLRARRRWYEENREHALAYASERHLALNPRERSSECRSCLKTFTYETIIGRKRLAFCPECVADSRKKIKARYREKNREKLREANREYARRTCDNEARKERERKRAAEWRTANPELARQRRREFYLRHRERLRGTRKSASVKRREAVYARDEATCHLCGGHVAWNEFEVDHIIPVSGGGSNDLQNLAASHMKCNRRKGKRLIKEVIWV